MEIFKNSSGSLEELIYKIDLECLQPVESVPPSIVFPRLTQLQISRGHPSPSVASEEGVRLLNQFKFPQLKNLYISYSKVSARFFLDLAKTSSLNLEKIVLKKVEREEIDGSDASEDKSAENLSVPNLKHIILKGKSDSQLIGILTSASTPSLESFFGCEVACCAFKASSLKSLDVGENVGEGHRRRREVGLRKIKSIKTNFLNLTSLYLQGSCQNFLQCTFPKLSKLHLICPGLELQETSKFIKKSSKTLVSLTIVVPSYAKEDVTSTNANKDKFSFPELTSFSLLHSFSRNRGAVQDSFIERLDYLRALFNLDPLELNSPSDDEQFARLKSSFIKVSPRLAKFGVEKIGWRIQGQEERAIQIE